MKRNLVFVFGILGAALFVVSSILGGLWIEGYSFVSQYISESFATGVPNAEYLRFMYILSGVLLLIFGILAPSFFPKSRGIRMGFLAFAFFYGLGNVIVSLYPCDFGCPTALEGSSLAQLIHNASAFLTYMSVPLSLILIGLSAMKKVSNTLYSRVSMLAGIVAFTFVVILFKSPQGAYIGLFQRIIEGSILTWVIYTAFFVRAERR